MIITKALNRSAHGTPFFCDTFFLKKYLKYIIKTKYLLYISNDKRFNNK
jgi:hypothetical protein